MRGLALEEAEVRSQSRAGPNPKPSPDDLATGRQPVVLVLDSALQSLPWESLPRLKAQRCAAMQTLNPRPYPNPVQRGLQLSEQRG